MDARLDGTSDSQPSELVRSSYHVGIIGAGLVGLLLGIALRQAGYQVSAFDTDHELKEIGAGIILPPNACRTLAQAGVLETIQENAVAPEAWVTHSYRDSAVLSRLELDENFKSRYGAPFLVIYRPALRKILFDAAVACGAEVNLGTKIDVHKTDFENGILYAEDGSRCRVNLVIAADGQQSEARELLSGKPNRLMPTGRMVNRVLIEPSIMQRVGMKELVEKPGLHVWLGPGTLGVGYFLGNVFNVALTCSSEHEPAFTGPKLVEKSELRAAYQPWSWQISELIENGHGFLKWLLYDVDNKPQSWVKRGQGKLNLVLTGDAAHAVGPYIGCGAALGFESAMLLAQLLKLATNEADILPMLDIYESIRKPRTDLVARMTKKMGEIWLLPDGPLQAERDRTFRTEDPPIAGYPNALEDPFFQEWLYSFDGKREAIEAWEEYCQRNPNSRSPTTENQS